MQVQRSTTVRLNATVECYSDLVAQITADSLTLSGAGVTSACGMSYVVTRSALPAFDNCPATYTITWTVTDSCGRSIDCTTDYTIDNAGPTIDNCPADATVECYSDLVAQITADSLTLSGARSDQCLRHELCGDPQCAT